MKLCKSRPIYWYTNIVYSEGYSVSWCLRNREDQILLTLLWTPWRKTPEQYLQSSLYLMSLMGSIKHGYQHSIDIHKKTMFVACRLCLERCLEISDKSRSVKSTTFSTHLLTKMTTTLNIFSMSLRHVLAIMRAQNVSLSTSS